MVNDPFSTFKRHSAWFTERSGPSPHQPHTPSIDAYWRRRAQPPDPRLPRWECLGPFNTAGRVTSLAVHPSQPDRLWAGAAAGGVWTSSDAGANWQSCWPVWACPNIGALALDAARPNHIFCATGEANLSPDCYPGTGLYHSRDAGRSWNMLASAEAQGLPPRIGVLVPSRLSPGVLYLGGGTLDDQHPAGLYSSSNGGRSWVRHNQPSPSNYWCHSLVEHPGGFLLAALGLGGAQSGIWRGEPGGGAWHRVQAGLPSGDHTGRIGLALSPSHPDTVYALVGDRAGNKVLGIFRSRDGGRRWHETGGTHFRSEAQSCYNSAIAVHPLDPDVVMCGLNDLHLSRDGGATWQRVTRWDASDGNPRAVHADQHAIVFAGGDRIYSATDGGVATSGDLGRSWHMCPRAMVNTMFYDIDVAPANASILGGGAQDNGTLMAGVSGEPGDFLHVLDGDGAWIVFHPGPESLVTGSRSDIHIYRHSPAHGWDPESWKEISPKRMSDDEHHQNAIAVLAVHPTDPLTIWAGSRRHHRHRNSAGRAPPRVGRHPQWRPLPQP